MMSYIGAVGVFVAICAVPAFATLSSGALTAKPLPPRMAKRAIFAAAIAATIGLAASSQVFAATLFASAEYGGSAQPTIDESPGTQVHEVTLGTSDDGASSIVRAFPFVQLTTSAVSPGIAGDDGWGAHGEIDYSFSIVGPSGVVPVSVNTLLSATASGAGSFSEVNFDLYDPASDKGLLSLTACSSECTGAPTSINVSDIVDVTANTPIDIQEEIHSDTNGLQGSATAYADPYLYIDPTFLSNNPEYKLVVENGVGNGPIAGVPEPATWAMMLLGVCMIGAGLRVARRKNPMELTAA